MRVTPEQFQWRKENRIDGSYVSKPPEAYGRRNRAGRTRETPKCANCGRETEYLFAGFVYPDVVADKTIKRGQYAKARALRALSAPFQTTPGEVCLVCRPPSNLEIAEMLHGQS